MTSIAPPSPAVGLPQAALPDHGEPPLAPMPWRLCLVVAGGSGRSRRAIENLSALCATHLPGAVDVEVVDIYRNPELAERYQVIAAPTLVRLSPLPVRRVVGDLSHTAAVLRGLDLAWT